MREMAAHDPAGDQSAVSESPTTAAPLWTGPVIRFSLSVIAVLVLGSVLIILGGANPMNAFRALIEGSFGSRYSFGETLIRFAPLALIAAGLAPSLNAGLFNIGAPGQFGIGALAATGTALALREAPGVIVLIASALGACAAGTAWVYVPAVLRARLGINEIFTTFVFNFLALYLLTFLLNGPIRAAGANVPESEALPEQAMLPSILPETRAHLGVLVGIAALMGLAVLANSVLGYRIRLFGGNPFLAVRAGIREPRLIIGLLCLGGAAAGLAGWMQVSGVDHRLYPNVSDVVGFSGLFVALLGSSGAVGIFVASLLFAALLKGGESLQVASTLAPELIDALVGVIVLVYVGERAIRRRRRRAR